jgi:adenylate kinase family enzyme
MKEFLDPDVRKNLQILRELRSFLDCAGETIRLFWRGNHLGFTNFYGSNSTTRHTINTARAVETLFGNPWLQAPNDNLAELKSFDFRSFFEDTVQPNGTWMPPDQHGVPHDIDIYEASLVLKSLPQIGFKDTDTLVSDNLRRLYNGMESLFPSDDSGTVHTYKHPFFILLSMDAFEAFSKAQVNDTQEPLRERIFKSIERDLYRQIALVSSGDRFHFDLVTLAIDLIIATKYGKFSNVIVIDKALDIIFAQQLENGCWATNSPIIVELNYGQMSVVGCSSFFLADNLLDLPRMRERFPDFVKNYSSLLTWLKNNARYDHSINAPRWNSDTYGQLNESETWFNAVVLDFMGKLHARLQSMVAAQVLDHFSVDISAPKIAWTSLSDSYGYKSTIERTILSPVRTRSGFGNQLSCCSIILYGPPGTAKTSIAKAVAYELNWPLVSLSPSDFLIDSYENIFRRAKEIFEHLYLMENVVVLFDEIDEMVADRPAEKEKMGKFITTSMLPWIQRLREIGRVVFIFATNHIEVFDPAIKRHGRFDLVLPIGPPDKVERLRLLQTWMQGQSPKLVAAINDRFTDRITIGELKQFVEWLRQQTGNDSQIEKLAIGRITYLKKELSPLIDAKTYKKFVGSLEFRRE